MISIHERWQSSEHICIASQSARKNFPPASNRKTSKTKCSFQLRSPSDANSCCKQLHFEKCIDFGERFFIDEIPSYRNTDFSIERVREVAKMLEGIHDYRSFMKVSKEQRTHLTRFCWRSIESIQVRPGTTLATSFNTDKTLALYDFWDIEFKSKAYFYRQVERE